MPDATAAPCPASTASTASVDPPTDFSSAFGSPDLTVFCKLDDLGLIATGLRLDPDRAVVECRVVEPDSWCRTCGCEGRPRDTVVRTLVHEPLGWRPTQLHVIVRRYSCTGCGRVWRQDTTRAAEPRARLSRGGLRWALHGIVVAHLSVKHVAAALGVAWNTANKGLLHDQVTGRARRICPDIG